jgi:hypothetical protein
MKCKSSSHLGLIGSLVAASMIGWAAMAQTPELPAPRTVNYSGVTMDSNGQAAQGIMGTAFAIYAEQPRVALLSVPYALTAVDAKSLGGPKKTWSA